MTETPYQRPPFRADHVGSLLRPTAIHDARAKGLTGAALTEIEDREIPALIRLQEDAGLKVVTDGEARRAFWHYDFMGMLNGLEIVRRDEDGVAFAGEHLPPFYPTITGPISFPDDHPMLEHFRFVAAQTQVCPKISIPGPSCVHYRVEKKYNTYAPYHDPEAFFAAIAATYKQAVKAFYDAGCRYLQLDDIYFAYLGDEKQREMKRAEGYDPDWLIDRYAWMLNEAIKDRPADMITAMHMCRGNFKSTFVASGGYDAAADAIFNKTDIDIYFMEYDDDRSGGFEPLRLLPKGHKRVLPGVITTKTPQLESLDDIRRKFDMASKYTDLGQLGIAPQCGFSSTEHGNKLTEDDERRKLDLVVRVAEKIWGEV
ncbi:MAG TPA: 5-methyltetrahydropteroyltriglutamate--homocysteine S-methyltransferase [Paenirhodobacter sp.]